jgi:putative transposase
MPYKLKRFIGRQDFHFITFTCYQRRKFLASMNSRNITTRILGEVRDRFRFKLIGYVLVPDHVHLIISEPPGATPGKAMQVFKQRVSRLLRGSRRRNRWQLCLAFPDQSPPHRRFWQRRYFDMNLYSAYMIRQKLDYIHANPVKEKLVTHPKDWPWSSWAAYVGKESLLAVDFD